MKLIDKAVLTGLTPLLALGLIGVMLVMQDPSEMSQAISETEVRTTKNRLQSASSPYLLQHAENPVDWFQWGPEAFEQARSLNKPLFLSIGYSTCHWCHVMAHESFEDPQVARLMNEAFVCVKVDREERPDVDNVYMTVCQQMTGGGGWPLTIIMTPDAKPFFAATYIPKQSRFGRVGMLELVPRIQSLWQHRQGDVLQLANQATASLRGMVGDAVGEAPDAATLQRASQQLVARFDGRFGGFGDAPKFPTPHNLTFLLRQWRRTGQAGALEMVEKTLQAMQRGGIYDHVGFGFHRYATDRQWLVPHFEKMLYDQALLAAAYVEAYQATGKEEYAATVREIFTYVLRDMTSPESGFYSAQDADSEGEEGKFYLWTEAQIRRVLEKDQADLVVKVFNVTAGGNFAEEATGQPTGANILHLTRPLGELASELGITEPDLRTRIEAARLILFAQRTKRVPPHTDDKILTDWNGLMIAALAKAARALGEPGYAQAASRAADFILSKMRTPDGRLLHRYRAGHAGLTAHVDDYAFLIWGLIELYETTFDAGRLRTAIELNNDLIKHFWDEEHGGLFFTADDAEPLLLRQKEVYDGAVPSGNSVAMLNLLQLARLTGETDHENRAAAIGRTFAKGVKQLPAAHTHLMLAVDFAVGPTHEVVIAGSPGADDTRALLRALHKRFLPSQVVLLRPTDQDAPDIVALAPFTRDHSMIDGKAAAYVCTNQTCKLPTTRTDDMLELLE